MIRWLFILLTWWAVSTLLDAWIDDTDTRTNRTRYRR